MSLSEGIQRIFLNLGSYDRVADTEITFSLCAIHEGSKSNFLVVRDQVRENVISIRTEIPEVYLI